MPTSEYSDVRVSGVENALFEQKIRNRNNRANAPKKEQKPKPYAIQLHADHLYKENYLMKLSKGGLSYTRYESGAKRFTTQKQAEKYIKDKSLSLRFNKLTYSVVNIEELEKKC